MPKLRPIPKLAALALLVASALPAAAEFRGTARVLDGDTLEIGLLRIRLHGIDAPELAQTCARADGRDWPCGRAAAERLRALAEGAEVRCTALERDFFGRLVSRCSARGTDLAGALAREGHAWAYTRFSDEYRGAEAAAREAARGIWQGAAQVAWEFRETDWKSASGEAPRADCPVKGNINGKGDRIYHTPASPHYARTRINEALGEAWFCDAAEAEAAGWRPAGGTAP